MKPVKFSSNLFGYNKKEVYTFIKDIDQKYSSYIRKLKKELATLKESEELVNKHIKTAFPLTDNPVYLQTSEQVEELRAEVEELKMQAKVLTEYIDETLPKEQENEPQEQVAG